MLDVSDKEIQNQLVLDNPWWESGEAEQRFVSMPRRAYFHNFHKLFAESSVQRAVVLMGPRRVGKSVMLHQSIHELLQAGVAPTTILRVTLETPIYSGIPMDRLFQLFRELHGYERQSRLYVLLDEIQYHRDWERHLKVLVDTFHNVRFVASGSAAAALKLKSVESGAGRFTDFILPPLTFFEFLHFRSKNSDKDASKSLNAQFVDFLNFGGFPEAVTISDVAENMPRYVREDIIDKVLLRDLPSMYGVRDVQELNRFFAMLAYNTAQEVSVPSLAKKSNVAENTLKKYLDYLEAAFLIKRLYRVTPTGKRFKKQTRFKVYLTNPCLRSALFGPVRIDDQTMGAMAETAVFANRYHFDWSGNLHYVRTKSFEIDFVVLSPTSQQLGLLVEVKWSDRYAKYSKDQIARRSAFGALIDFAKNTGAQSAVITTREHFGKFEFDGIELTFMPVAHLCSAEGLYLNLKLEGLESDVIERFSNAMTGVAFGA